MQRWIVSSGVAADSDDRRNPPHYRRRTALMVDRPMFPQKIRMTFCWQSSDVTVFDDVLLFAE